MAQYYQPDPEVVKIIRDCQAGSRGAFRLLMDRYQRSAYGLAYRMLHNAELAKDISQEAFVRVFYSIQRFNLRKSFYTWLYHIVVRLSIDYLRTHKSGVASDPEIMADHQAATPADQLIKKEEQVIIRETLDHLPPRYRAVLILRDIEGLPSREVARVLKCSDGAVRWTLCEARKLFKDEWLKRQVAK